MKKIQQQFLEGITNPRRQVSPHLATEIDREVKAVIENAHQIAQEILQANQQLLAALAQILLEQEILEGEQLRSHLAQAQKTIAIEKWLQTGKPTRNNLLAPKLAHNGKPAKLSTT